MADDVGSIIDDDVLERELQQAMKSEGEIELFKIVNKSLRIRGELANSESVRVMMSLMWANVADFFDAVTNCTSLQDLAAENHVVALHHEMRANFKVVATINATIKAGREAENELRAVDQMEHDSEEDL